MTLWCLQIDSTVKVRGHFSVMVRGLCDRICVIVVKGRGFICVGVQKKVHRDNLVPIEVVRAPTTQYAPQASGW